MWQMVTTNGALAVGAPDLLGALAPGHVADIAIYDGKDRRYYRAILEGSVEDVALVLRGGKALYGDAAIIDAFPTKMRDLCEAIDVCTVGKKLCNDSSVSLPKIVEATTTNRYPLFFCRGEVPEKEPSCIPYRDAYPNGTSATDRDGDGVNDDVDDCPDTFNPPRPMDANVQADGDGDGEGDACDETP
jgi:hypothetical protein